MTTQVRAIRTALVAMALAGVSAGAQTQSLPRPPKACSMIASVISVRIVDAAGKPVSSAKVRLTRLRDGKSLGLAQEMAGGSGEFEIVESAAIRWIAPRGDRIQLDVRAGRRSTKAVVRVGRDPDGCRLAKLAGPDVITLK